MMKRTLIREIFTTKPVDQEVVVKGWIRSVRNSKKFSFVVLNDGSDQDSLQIVVDATLPNYQDVAGLLMGSAIGVKGKIVASNGKQPVEMLALEIEVIGRTTEEYPLQKKATSLEFLREQAHLRIRTNTFGAVARVRHELAQATHKFFSERGFFYLNSPILSAVDAEGAGEMFAVTSFNLNEPEKFPKTNGKVDFSKDYFGKEAFLCVTGQLEGECYAMGLGQIYTFGPTFRSENSNTTRHLSEFWMIEPEIAFAGLDEVAELGADYIKYMINHALTYCSKELEFLLSREESVLKLDHIETLKHVRDSKFQRVTYRDAMAILEKCGKKFEYPVGFGHELQTEHERFLAEEHFKAPVIVTDYPKQFKAFYMKLNPDNETVRAMDILVPGIGEIIGGSQREDKLELLQRRMDELNMQQDPLWWYLDLRRFGSVPHAGFGLGFERAIMYITGMTNIRDVIPFPRTPKNCDF